MDTVNIIDLIDTAEWTNDCCGKKDLDFPLLQCSTRYYPDMTAYPKFMIYNNATDEYEFFLEAGMDAPITGKNFEEVSIKTRKWYKEHLKEVAEKFYQKVLYECKQKESD